MKKELNDKILAVLGTDWKKVRELFHLLKGVFASERRLMDYCKRMKEGGIIQGEYNRQKGWWFASLETGPFGERERHFQQAVKDEVLKILADGNWMRSSDIIGRLPKDMKKGFKSLLSFSRMLRIFCDEGAIKRDYGDKGRVYADLSAGTLKIADLYSDVIEHLEGRGLLLSELMDEYRSTGVDVERCLEVLMKKGFVRKCNNRSAYCGAGYVEDEFFRLNACFVQMARQTTMRNVYEYMR